MNRSGSLVVADEKGRERERYPIVYGARLKVKDGQKVEQGQVLVEWDPYTFSILTEDPGVAKFKDIIDGVTVHEEVDEVTGLSRFIIVDSPDEKKQPTIEIKDKAGQGPAEVPHAVARPPHGAGRRDGGSRRRAGEDPARDHQDQGHHRRSAARGRAVRGAQAQGSGGHLRDRRHRQGRRRRQGPAQDDHRARRRHRAAGVRAAARRARQRPRGRARARRRTADGRPEQPARHPAGAGREGAAEVPGERNPGGLPAAGREHQRQAHRGDLRGR